MEVMCGKFIYGIWWEYKLAPLKTVAFSHSSNKSFFTDTVDLPLLFSAIGNQKISRLQKKWSQKLLMRLRAFGSKSSTLQPLAAFERQYELNFGEHFFCKNDRNLDRIHGLLEISFDGPNTMPDAFRSTANVFLVSCDIILCIPTRIHSIFNGFAEARLWCEPPYSY